MAVSDPILAKLALPKAEGVLLRTALFARLDEYREQSLVWIAGPGGSGKTTLLSSYLTHRRLPHLWYQVDGGDADPASFFYYLGLAGKKAAPQRKTSLPLLTPEYLGGLHEFSRNFFAELFSRLGSPAVIVLDNVQEVPDSAPLHQCLIDSLARIPKGLTLVLISRSEPPEPYVKFRANREMELLGWEDLRLTRDEFGQIASGLEVAPDPQSLKTLYDKMDGWVAGLRLMLRPAANQVLPQAAEWQQPPGDIFAYFADQLFRKVAPEVQLGLQRTAFVTRISPQMAGQLSGNPRFPAILRDLAHRNFFTTRCQLATLSYQYHPLFQLFLQDTAVRNFSARELRDLKSLSARALLAEARPDEAAQLLADIDDREGLIALILDNAPGLREQGRYETLRSWLALLPAAEIAGRPWLCYWQAVALKTLDVAASREHFRRAYDLFRAAQDPAGSYASWTGAVETFIYLWGNFRALDPWLEEFQRLQQDHPRFPDPATEQRTTYAMFSALLWRRSNSPEMALWAERAGNLLRHSEHPRFRISTASNLLKYYLWCCGDLARADLLIDGLQKIDRQAIAPLDLLLSQVMLATYYWFRNEMASCLRAVEAGLEIGRDSGIHLMDTALHAHGVYARLMRGQREEAREHLTWMGKLTDQQSHLDVAHYHYLWVWLHLEEGHPETALNNARIVIDRIEAAGTRQARGFGRYTLGVALCENGHFSEAEEALARGREYGQSMANGYFEAMYRFSMALLRKRQGDTATALEHLSAALALVDEKNYPTLPWIGWYRSAFTELLQLALEHQVGVARAQRLIRDHRLMPASPPLHLENWPWLLDIRTLGPFQVICNGQPLRFERKAQKRPLEILQALIALGGRDISQTRIEDALWPNAAGDAARKAFNSGLYRLRKLVPPEALILEKGQLSLDPRFCRVDLWVLEQALDRVETLLQEGEIAAERLFGESARVLALLQGAFLEQAVDQPWLLPMRNRLRQRIRRLFRALGHAFGRLRQCDQAMAIYSRAIEVDPLAEEFYRCLMGCYAAHDRTAEARSTYLSWQEICSSLLKSSPSPKTEELLAAITRNSPDLAAFLCRDCLPEQCSFHDFSAIGESSVIGRSL